MEEKAGLIERIKINEQVRSGLAIRMSLIYLILAQ
jgi:hypothetical protein